MSDELTPGTEGATGQGGEGQSAGTSEGQSADYAGFSTPEELVSAYQSTVQEQDALKTQISNLESLKGRHGNEIGQLRQQLAQLTGQIEGMRSSQKTEPQMSIEDIKNAVLNGQMTEAEGIALASQTAEKRAVEQAKTELSNQFNQFKQQTAQERAVEKFLSENQGYVEALESGKLDQWLDIAPDGTKTGGKEAWTQYQLHTTRAELEALKQKAASAAAEAEKGGIDKGLELAKSKANAGKVLNGKGGQFSQNAGNYDLNNPSQRRQAGIALLGKLRTG